MITITEQSLNNLFISTISNDLDSSCFTYMTLNEAYQFFDEITKQGFSINDISPKELEITNACKRRLFLKWTEKN